MRTLAVIVDSPLGKMHEHLQFQESKGMDLRVKFDNKAYLLPVVKKIEGESTTLYWNEPTTRFFVCDPSTDTQFIVMPIIEEN